MSTDQKMYQVFISHASSAKGSAKQTKRIVDAIPNVTAFLDEKNIEGGADFLSVIIEGIKSSNEVWVLFNHGYTLDSGRRVDGVVDRPWVWLEIGAAVALGIPIVPIRIGMTIDEYLGNNKIPHFLKTVKSIDNEDPHESDTLYEDLELRANKDT